MEVIYNFIYNFSLWKSMFIIAKILNVDPETNNNTFHINHMNKFISFHFLYILNVIYSKYIIKHKVAM